MNASSYQRSLDTTAYKVSSTLILFTNSLILGAGLRTAITRLFNHNTRQIETQQHEQKLIDAPKSEVEATISKSGDPIRHPIDNGSTEKHTASRNQFIVSIRGLKNHGQTCYCNSVLQALAALKPFYCHLESLQSCASNNLIDALRCTIKHVNGHDSSYEKKRTHSAFSSLFPFLSGEKSPGDTRTIMDRVAQHYSQFRSRNNLGIAGTTEQQDSHEFLAALMDVLSMEEQSVVQSKTRLSSPEGICLIHSQPSGDEVDEHVNNKCKPTTDHSTNAEDEYNEIQEEKKHDDLHGQEEVSNTKRTSNRRERRSVDQQHNPFDGWLGSTIKCTKCLHIRPIRSSPFICASLPIATIRSEYLEDFLSSEYGGFSTAERVSDVQCVACGIKEKVEELEDEVMILSGAIESMVRRNKGKTDQAGLESEIAIKNRHIAILKGMDADNDDEIQNHNEEDISFNLAGLVGLPKIIPMRGDAYKATLIMRPPKVLCIHIQRRHFDMTSQRMVKISRRVRFPEILDLSKYCAYAENAFENECSTESTDKLPYKLMSVVEHRGSAFGGHYQTYRRVGSNCNEWVLVSDESVVPRSWEDVQTCEAYMLLYEEMTSRDQE